MNNKIWLQCHPQTRGVPVPTGKGQNSNYRDVFVLGIIRKWIKRQIMCFSNHQDIFIPKKVMAKTNRPEITEKVCHNSITSTTTKPHKMTSMTTYMYIWWRHPSIKTLKIIFHHRLNNDKYNYIIFILVGYCKLELHTN